MARASIFDGHSSPWKMHEDPTSGRPYYVNRATNETTWDRPADYVDPASTLALSLPVASTADGFSAFDEGVGLVSPASGNDAYISVASQSLGFGEHLMPLSVHDAVGGDALVVHWHNFRNKCGPLCPGCHACAVLCLILACLSPSAPFLQGHVFHHHAGAGSPV